MSFHKTSHEEIKWAERNIFEISKLHLKNKQGSDFEICKVQYESSTIIFLGFLKLS